MTFDEFVAEKDAVREERDRDRVTWRKAHWYEGRNRGKFERVNGYSGIGRGGRLVFVCFNERARRDDVYPGEWEYGLVDLRGVERVGETRARRDREGSCRTFTEAKARAAVLLREGRS